MYGKNRREPKKHIIRSRFQYIIYIARQFTQMSMVKLFKIIAGMQRCEVKWKDVENIFSKSA